MNGGSHSLLTNCYWIICSKSSEVWRDQLKYTLFKTVSAHCEKRGIHYQTRHAKPDVLPHTLWLNSNKTRKSPFLLYVKVAATFCVCRDIEVDHYTLLQACNRIDWLCATTTMGLIARLVLAKLIMRFVN